MLVVCNGMIRSGSTLQYNIVRELIETKKIGEAHGYYNKKELKRNIKTLDSYLNDKNYHIIKVHEMPREWFENIGNNSSYVYIYRDIRDVAASVKEKFGHSNERLIESIDKAIESFYEIKKLNCIKVQKYEDLIENPKEAIWDLAEFLDIPVADFEVSKIENATSMDKAISTTNKLGASYAEKALRILKKIKIPFKFFDKKTLLHMDHISKTKGTTGVWMDKLNPYEKDMLNKKFYGWLEENGYLS